MSTSPEPSILDDHLTAEQARPVHGLYERAAAFLADYDNPLRLRFAYTLGVASVGQEVEGAYYRLTDCYALGTKVPVTGLVAVEQVPDEAVTEDGKSANEWVGTRLWRLQPARVGYAAMGYDSVFGATIEDLQTTKLESFEHHDNFGGRRQTEYHMPYRNFKNELKGDALENAARLTGLLLDKLGAQ